MTEDRNIPANLGLKTTGVEKTIADISRVTRALMNQKKVADSTITSMRDNLLSLVRASDKGRASIKALTDETKQLKQENKRLQESGGGGDGGTGRGRAALRGAGGAVGRELGGPAGQLLSAFTSLNPAMIAGGVAAVGVGAAMDQLRSSGEEAAKELERQFALEADLIDLKKLTSEELGELHAARLEEIEDLEALSESTAKTAQDVLDAEPALPKAAKSFEDFAGNIDDSAKFLAFGILDTIGILGQEGDEAQEHLDGLTDSLKDAEGELENVDEALRSSAVAANDAAAAMDLLIEQMEADLVDAASDAGEAIREETAALLRTKEANIDRIAAIEAETRAIEAEIEVLKPRAKLSQDVTDKIANLTEKLSDLGRESETVAVIMSTQVSEAFKKAAEEARKAAEDAAKEAEREREKAAKELKKKREDELKDIIDFGNKRAEIEFDAQVDRQQIAIDANREQARLIRESKQQFNQDFFQDFLGEFQRKQELAFSLSETQIGAGQAFSDVNLGVQNSLLKLSAQQNETPVTTNNVNNFNFTGAEQAQIIALLQQLGVTQ